MHIFLLLSLVISGPVFFLLPYNVLLLLSIRAGLKHECEATSHESKETTHSLAQDASVVSLIPQFSFTAPNTKSIGITHQRSARPQNPSSQLPASSPPAASDAHTRPASPPSHVRTFDPRDLGTPQLCLQEARWWRRWSTRLRSDPGGYFGRRRAGGDVRLWF